MELAKYFENLGYMVKDKVTGFTGTCDSVCFDLYGCVQCTVRPIMNDKGELPDPKWFDSHRLDRLSAEPVMTLPNFAVNKEMRDKAGAADKPLFDRHS